MKTILKFFKIVILFLIISCSNNPPEDVYSHEEINTITLTITETGSTNIQTVSFQTGTGATAPINLINGKTYIVSIAFYYQNGSYIKDLTSEIITEKDEHFITYLFSNIGVTITRATDDTVRTDGKKLGIKTVWVVNSAPSNANANIKLVHLPTSVSDTDNNGGGSTTGGEEDVNATFIIN